MIVLDQERLSDFFEMVSSGFGATRVEIIIVIAAVVAFLAVLLTFYLIQPRSPGIFRHHRVHRVAVRVVAGSVEIDAVERRDPALRERANTCHTDQENRYEPIHCRH